MADTQTQHIQLHRLKGEWMAEVNRLWSAARRIQKEGLRRPRSQRTSHRRADGGADEEEGGRGQGTERDATIDGQQIIDNTPTRKRATKHKTFTPRTHQASFTSHQHANQGLPPLYRAPPSPPKRPSTTRDANGHTSTARSRRKSPRHRSNLKGRKSDSQLYGHHMSRGSYDPMNCTASCFVVGPHLMMVLETFPLHLFPLGLTTTEKVRPALSRVLVILRLARRACLSCGSEASVPACASALARVSACARALSTTWRSEAKSRLVCLAQAVLGRDCSERLYPLPVRTILDRCTPQVGVR